MQNKYTNYFLPLPIHIQIFIQKIQALELRFWNSEFKLDLNFHKILDTQIEQLEVKSLTVLGLFWYSTNSSLLLCFDLWSHCLCLFLHGM